VGVYNLVFTTWDIKKTTKNSVLMVWFTEIWLYGEVQNYL